MLWQKADKLSAKKFKTKGKLNYSSRQYNNPYFGGPKKRKIAFELSFKIKIIILSALILVIGALIWILYSGFFTITNFSINGQGRIPKISLEKTAREQIDNSFLKFWPRKNIFIYSTSKLKEELQNKYAFNELTVERRLPRTIVINYKEKKYALIWQEDDRYYYADSHGYIITEANLLEIKQKDYPLIENLTEKKIKDIKVSIDESILSYAIGLFNKFKDYDKDFKIDHFLIDDNSNILKIVLANGPELYFSASADMDKQLNKLLILKQEKLKDDFNKKTYINLSYGDRVYYR